MSFILEALKKSENKHRQEKGQNDYSATQEVSQNYHIPVLAIISLTDIIEYLETYENANNKLAIIKEYRHNYGI